MVLSTNFPDLSFFTFYLINFPDLNFSGKLLNTRIHGGGYKTGVFYETIRIQ